MSGGSIVQNVPLQPQELAERPRLERTAAGAVRGVAVRDLRKVSQSPLGKVLFHRLEEPLAGDAAMFFGIAMNSQPRLDKRPEKPRPDCPLVVRGVAFKNPP
jgi:hypothetical protein